MPEAVIVLFLVFTVLLSGIGAFRISRSAYASLSKRGSGWAWIVGTLSFIFSFAVFFVGMALVFGMVFGR